MADYPRLPRTRRPLGKRQFSMSSLMLVWLGIGTGIGGYLAGDFARFVVGLAGGLAICVFAAWRVSRLRPLTAALTTMYTFFGLLILSASGLGGVPMLREAFLGGFRGYQTMTSVLAIVLGWYALLLMLGMIAGTLISRMRGEVE